MESRRCPRATRWQREYQLPAPDAQTFVWDPVLGAYFESIAKAAKDPKAIANWVINNLRAKLTETASTVSDLKFEPDAIPQLVNLVAGGLISSRIAQEVFAILWSKAGSFQEKSAFTTWLYRIVVNQWLQSLRKARRHAAVSLDAIPTDGNVPESLQVEVDREQARRVAAVRQAVAALPESQRMALVLSSYQELSYEEIAEAMATSVASVRSLIFRAKETLRNQLRELRTQ